LTHFDNIARRDPESRDIVPLLNMGGVEGGLLSILMKATSNILVTIYETFTLIVE